MTHIRSRSLAAAFAALLLAAIPTAGYGASPPDARLASCGPSTYVLDLTAPADPNAATVVTVELGSDCLPSLIGPVVVNTQLLGVTSPGHVVAASIGPSSSGAAEATAVNVSTRRAISQSIDAVGSTSDPRARRTAPLPLIALPIRIVMSGSPSSWRTGAS